jgi:hypothetical protein
MTVVGISALTLLFAPVVAVLIDKQREEAVEGASCVNSDPTPQLESAAKLPPATQ